MNPLYTLTVEEERLLVIHEEHALTESNNTALRDAIADARKDAAIKAVCREGHINL